MPLTSLPRDVLILLVLRLRIEDVLAVMQTCRVCHALGSLDLLWRTLLSDGDIPLDIPLNATLASLSGNDLRLAAVKALKLDNRWRNPRLEMHRAQRIISQNSSFVDGMCFLPGGRWLVTLQYERTVRTHMTLWSIADLNSYHSVFKITVVGRVRFLQAHHHHKLEQITIGIVFARDDAESIHVYDVLLRGDSPTCHSLVFEAMPDELSPMGRIAGIKIDGDIMIAVFVSLSSPLEKKQIVCANLASRATAVLECPVWWYHWYHWGPLQIFRKYFAVTTSSFAMHRTTADITFYELPSVILGHPDRLSPPAPCWPEKLAVKSALIARTSWSRDRPLVVEMSDDVRMPNVEHCSFTIFGYPIHTDSTEVDNTGIEIFRVSFDGCNIERALTTFSCHSIPSAGEVQVSSSGQRAVWLSMDSDNECILVKFASGREDGNNSGPCISTLMPSFSGLPFNPRDFHSFVFDDISCRMAVSLPAGELYILDY